MDLLPIVPLPDGSASSCTRVLPDESTTNCFPYQMDPLLGIRLRDGSATNSTATRWIQFQVYRKMDPLPLLPLCDDPLPVVPLPEGSVAKWIRYRMNLLPIVPQLVG